MSIALVVTAGFGNGTLLGTVKGVVLRGYDISTIIPPTIPDADGITVGGVLGDGIATKGNLGDGIAAMSSLGTGATVKGSL